MTSHTETSASPRSSDAHAAYASGAAGSGDLPPVLAGPILRRASSERLLLWLVASKPLELRLRLAPVDRDGEDEGVAQHGEDFGSLEMALSERQVERLAIGRHAVIHMIDVGLDDALPEDRLIAYDLRIITGEEEEPGVASYAPHLLYPGEDSPRFVLRRRLSSLLHGSCRRPHHDSGDGLKAEDGWLSKQREKPEERPTLLLMTGDQIYCDDVAGPMLTAIHSLVARLGLFDEVLQGAVVPDSPQLYGARDTYYHRDRLLPAVEQTATLRERLFGGVEKPVFTTASADNHLITLSEVLAMYLLVWSPTPWRLIEMREPELVGEDHERYRREARIIENFVETLPQAARVLAQVPTLMIFDDHDITDDWNLTADWEATVYGHPFSRRIIGNALIAYLLCQGWGNAPERLSEPLGAVRALLDSAGGDNQLDAGAQDDTITALLDFQGWDYALETSPKLVVLDTRTRRWRSESNLKRPSGLMDWEALSEFQQELLGNDSIVIVSPAPMFGVKLIETVQRIFTWAGHPLMVDAENWMAHRGAAKVMLNIFRHSRTPGRYVILSGDVHYSFAYDVQIRQRQAGPRIWQITSSGIKNEFPENLLNWFDRLNRWLYAPWSPLNWLTKRRSMEVSPRRPDRAKAGERLWNGAGIGLVRLDEEGKPSTIQQIGVNGVTASFKARG